MDVDRIHFLLVLCWTFCVIHWLFHFPWDNFLLWKRRGNERHSILAILVQQKVEGQRFFTIYTSKQMDEREGSNVRNGSNEVSRLWEFVRGFAVLDNKAKGGGITPISVCNSSGNKIPNIHNAASNKVHELTSGSFQGVSHGSYPVSWKHCRLGFTQLPLNAKQEKPIEPSYKHTSHWETDTI